MAALSVKFVNLTGSDFSRDYFGYVYQKLLSGPGTMPDSTLQKRGGSQSMSIDQMLSELDQGPLEIFCSWRTPDGHRFGVRLHANFQMFGLGNRPNWYVMTDTKTLFSPPDWQDSGSDPSIPYSWTSDFPFKITATPDSEHTALSLTIQIDEKQ